MSVTPVERPGSGDTVAGFLAAASIFASLIGVAYRPLRVIPFAILLALIASAMSARNGRLGALAASVGAACFVLGLALAVVTSHPLW